MENREIKFRLWDTSEKEFVKPRDIAARGDGSILADTGKEWVEDIDSDAFILMQYTGLKDKNGKEIYEGDTVGGFPHGTVTVRWNNEYACFECFWFDAEFDKDGEPHEKEFSSLFANELNDCKDAWVVLGNIYESPELIKLITI